MQQYIQELKKDTYRQARKNYKSKCIELTVVHDTEILVLVFILICLILIM